jgi:hypothetical protein
MAENRELNTDNLRKSRPMSTTPDAPQPSPDVPQLMPEGDPGLLRDFVRFLGENKKWWLIPILLVLGLLALFAALLSSPAAPFIYPLF